MVITHLKAVAPALPSSPLDRSTIFQSYEHIRNEIACAHIALEHEVHLLHLLSLVILDLLNHHKWQRDNPESDEASSVHVSPESVGYLDAAHAPFLRLDNGHYSSIQIETVLCIQHWSEYTT